MKPDPESTLQFLMGARDCAIQMMENSDYIRKELPFLRMPETLRERITSLCDALISTKHDLMHEIFEVSELLERSPESPVIWNTIRQMRGWISESVMDFHAIVLAVREAVDEGEADGVLSLLVQESGVNILQTMACLPGPEGVPEPDP
jgi:hypothetical protein